MTPLLDIALALAALGTGLGAKVGWDRWHPVPPPAPAVTSEPSPPPPPKVCRTRTFLYPDKTRIVQHARCGGGHGPHSDDVPSGWSVLTEGGHELPRT